MPFFKNISDLLRLWDWKGKESGQIERDARGVACLTFCSPFSSFFLFFFLSNKTETKTKCQGQIERSVQYCFSSSFSSSIYFFLFISCFKFDIEIVFFSCWLKHIKTSCNFILFSFCSYLVQSFRLFIFWV